MSISEEHGPLQFHGYEVGPDGRERAVYVSDWEASGSYVKKAPEPLTAKDFETIYDENHTFPFVETEWGVILAFGFQPKVEFAKVVREYDILCSDDYDIPHHNENEIQHIWAVREDNPLSEEWIVRWGVPSDTPGSFPITVIER